VTFSSFVKDLDCILVVYRSRVTKGLGGYGGEQINKRGDTIDEKIKKLDGELFRYREQIKKTRPGPAQEAIKARAMRILKQKKM